MNPFNEGKLDGVGTITDGVDGALETAAMHLVHLGGEIGCVGDGQAMVARLVAVVGEQQGAAAAQGAVGVVLHALQGETIDVAIAAQGAQGRLVGALEVDEEPDG